MHFVAIGIALLSLLIWIGIFFFNGHFWQIWISDADRETADPTAAWPSVVAIVPARNEAATIAQTVAALVQQSYPGHFSILIVDDHSEDGTAGLARKAAADSDAAEKVRVLTRAGPANSGRCNLVLNTHSQALQIFSGLRMPISFMHQTRSLALLPAPNAIKLALLR